MATHGRGPIPVGGLIRNRSHPIPASVTAIPSPPIPSPPIPSSTDQIPLRLHPAPAPSYPGRIACYRISSDPIISLPILSYQNTTHPTVSCQIVQTVAPTGETSASLLEFAKLSTTGNADRLWGCGKGSVRGSRKDLEWGLGRDLGWDLGILAAKRLSVAAAPYLHSLSPHAPSLPLPPLTSISPTT